MDLINSFCQIRKVTGHLLMMLNNITNRKHYRVKTSKFYLDIV